MKTPTIILLLAMVVYANCNSFGTNSFHTTNCYSNGVRETWNTTNTGNTSTTYYSNNQGTRGTSEQYNYGNGNYDRTYRNNSGYRSTTSKVGDTYYFRDNQGNRRTITCFGGFCSCTGNACK